MANGKTVNEVVEYKAKDGQQIKLTFEEVKKYFISGQANLVTQQEMYLYMGVCRSRGLNPFVRDCWLVKYTQNDTAAIITSIDYYRKRARAQRDCKGWSVGIVIAKDGELVYRKGSILLEGEKLVGGWAEATPDGWSEPMRKEVNLNRYIKRTKEGNPTRFWQPENQPEMIAKVAESQLLRSLWPDEFQGLYVDSEVQSRMSQEELSDAVGAAGADSKEPTFDEVFADEIAETPPGKPSPFIYWIEDTCNTYGETLLSFKPKLIANAASIKKQWAEEKKRRAVDPPHETAEPETKNDDRYPCGEQDASESAGGDKPKTFRDEWVGMTARSFGPFVNMEIDKFKAMEEGDKAEAARMWGEFYPGFKCPFYSGSVSEREPGDPGAADPPTGDPEISELQSLRAELKGYEKTHPKIVVKAKRNSMIALPSSIDGYVKLLDEVKRLIAEVKK